jgi:hypothetical protein
MAILSFLFVPPLYPLNYILALAASWKFFAFGNTSLFTCLPFLSRSPFASLWQSFSSSLALSSLPPLLSFFFFLFFLTFVRWFLYCVIPSLYDISCDKAVAAALEAPLILANITNNSLALCRRKVSESEDRRSGGMEDRGEGEGGERIGIAQNAKS